MTQLLTSEHSRYAFIQFAVRVTIFLWCWSNSLLSQTNLTSFHGKTFKCFVVISDSHIPVRFIEFRGLNPMKCSSNDAFIEWMKAGVYTHTHTRLQVCCFPLTHSCNHWCLTVSFLTFVTNAWGQQSPVSSFPMLFFFFSFFFCAFERFSISKHGFYPAQAKPLSIPKSNCRNNLKSTAVTRADQLSRKIRSTAQSELAVNNKSIRRQHGGGQRSVGWIVFFQRAASHLRFVVFALNYFDRKWSF